LIRIIIPELLRSETCSAFEAKEFLDQPILEADATKAEAAVIFASAYAFIFSMI
jgi:hypothetical protein